MSDVSALFPYKTVCVSGGTGTFGWAFLQYMREHHPRVHVRIISRHEDLQVYMRAEFGDTHISYLLGDICDRDRMRLALQGADLVIHAAALKHIDRGEYDPAAFMKTNVDGTYSVIHAAITAGVQQVIFLSSDKAVAPVSVYGATKMLAERLVIQANHYSPHGTRFAAVRYGNVANARGSVVKVWREALARGNPLTLTDERMTRFWMSIDEAIRLVVWTAVHGLRGGVVIPHLPAFMMTDLARAMLPVGAQWQVTGRRPGEKLAELLMTTEEQERCYWYGPSDRNLVCYVIPPLLQSWGLGDEFSLWAAAPKDGERGMLASAEQAPYSSATWRWQLEIEDLRQRLEKI